MIKKLDAYLQTQMQRLTDWLQVLTGFTKFKVEKWALIFSSICMFPACIEAVLRFGPMGSLFFVLFVMVAGFTTPPLIRSIELNEKRFLAGEAPALPCAPKENAVWFVVFGPISTFVSFGFLGAALLFMAAAIYANHCIPRPPGKSKVREKYEQGLQWLHEALQPPPDLAPKPMPCDR